MPVDNSKELSKQIDALVAALRAATVALEGFGIYIRKGVDGSSNNDRDMVGVAVKVDKPKPDRYDMANLVLAERTLNAPERALSAEYRAEMQAIVDDLRERFDWS